MLFISRLCCSCAIARKLRIRPVALKIVSSMSTATETSSSFAHASEDSENNKNEKFSDADRLDDEFVNSVMTSSLKYVNAHGWSMDAIIAGASEIAKQDQSIATVELATSMFSEDDLVRFFINKSNGELEAFLVDNKVSFHGALEYRLHKVVPYSERYSEAIALSTQPKNIAESLRQLQEIADSIAHYALSDKSTDISWYAKRLGLASIYASTELCLVQDKSADFVDTWSFLRRRCQDFENMKLHTGSQNMSSPLPELITAGVTTILNILQRNPRR